MSINRALAIALAIVAGGCGPRTTLPTGPSTLPTTPTGSPFQQHSSAHFVFHFSAMDAASIAETAARVEAEYSRVVADLGSPAMTQVTVFLHPDPESLRSAVQPIVGTVPSFANGLITNAVTIHILSPNRSVTWPYTFAIQQIVHEFAHCVSLRVNPSIANNPRWLWESVAIYEAGDDYVHQRITPFLVAGQPPSVARLNSFDNTDIYEVGFTIGEFVVTRWGRDTLVALIRNNGDTSTVVGLSQTAFLTEWYAFVRSRYFSG